MPSPLDLLEGGGDAVPPPAPPSADLLESVKAEGARRRTHRHRRNLAGAVLALGLLAVPAVALRSGDDSRSEVNVATDGGTVPDTVPPVVEPLPDDPSADTTVVTLPPDTGPLPTVPPTSVAATTGPPRTAPPRAVTTTTAKVCRNSTEPVCGPFRWEPPLVPDQPLVASFTVAPATAVVGQPVAFEVTWSDGDARLTYDRFSTDGSGEMSSCSRVPQYGPWTSPDRVPGSGKLPYTTTFDGPGTYKVTVVLGTGGSPGDIPISDCRPPYASATRIETTVTVTAPPP